MVAKKQNKKTIETYDDSDVSFDDMSDEELKKMLGNSDNSDLESNDFSDEEEVISKEAKANKKRKHESDDESDDNTSKKKVVKIDNAGGDDEDEDEDDEEDDEDDDEEDEDDEELLDDSFIDDDDEEEEIDETEKETVKPKVEKKVESKNKDKKEPKEKINKEAKVTEKKVDEDYKKLFEDTPKVESGTLRKEIENMLINRRKRTLVLLNLPFKFSMDAARQLIPELVSIIIPYDSRKHQIKGNAYVDMGTPELVAKYVKDLNGFKIKNKKLLAFPLNKADENVDNFNCTRLAISNLSSNTSVDAVQKLLNKANCVKMLPTSGKDRSLTRVAFAQYSSIEEAIQDMVEKHGSVVNGYNVNIKFQARTNTNIKKSSTWDKKCLEVFGIPKTVKEDDMKKYFPQAVKIHFVSGNQNGVVNYENEADCQVDFDNFKKIKPSFHMKVFFKSSRNKKPMKDSKEKPNSSSGFKKTEKNGKVVSSKPKDKKPFKPASGDDSNKKPFKPKAGDANKKPFKSNGGDSNKKSFNKRKQQSEGHGVKKSSFKPKNQKTK